MTVKDVLLRLWAVDGDPDVMIASRRQGMEGDGWHLASDVLRCLVATFDVDGGSLCCPATYIIYGDGYGTIHITDKEGHPIGCWGLIHRSNR